MQQYRATIRADKYPYDYDSVGTSWPAAVARAVRLWMQTKGKGSKTKELHIRIVKL